MGKSSLTENEINEIKKIISKKPMSASEIRARTGYDYYQILFSLQNLEKKEFEKIEKPRGTYWKKI